MTRITVQGNERMSRGEVLNLLDGLSGASIVMTDLESWKERLLASPWVADASIRRMFPGTLTVVIEERRPMGVGRIEDRLYLDRPNGHRHRRVRSQLRRHRICRSSTDWRGPGASAIWWTRRVRRWQGA